MAAITTEKLAYWYFRLNGFFGNSNFIIHRGLEESDHATDIDYLGIRFMHRNELHDSTSNERMEDDPALVKFCPKDKIFICLAEVKRGTPKINASQRENPNALKQLLLSLGCVCEKQIPKVVEKLQKDGFYTIDQYHISFIAVGNANTNHDIPFEIPIIYWDEVLKFIYNRLQKIEKANLKEWDGFTEIKELKELAKRDFDDFRSRIKKMHIID